MPRFKLNPDSRYLDRSEAQQGMMDVIMETDDDGIIKAPCAAGKTAVITESLVHHGTLGLVLCYESQGVSQMADAIRKNTTVLDCQLFVYNGKSRNQPSGRFCYLVTTYGMLSLRDGEHRSEKSRSVRDWVMRTQWDLVCCDEFHHACAPTYKPMIQALRAKRKLGFTATLFRSELCGHKPLSIEAEEQAFGWFGRVLYRRLCKELEAVGLIAKIRRAAVHVDLTREFAQAYAMAKGAQNIYLAALNPAKLNALVAICTRHTQAGHAGIVFANHLLVAKVAKQCLGDGWEVLSGGAAHGEDEMHTPERNAEIVQRFNKGELAGMVCTAVGESSMDAHLQSFCFVCVLDADGGIASAAQRLGRVARSERLNQDAGESQAQLTTRRLAHQKDAVYYDLITRNTAEVEAAATRQLLFMVEGYTTEQEISYDRIVGMASEAGVNLPQTTLVNNMRLLKEILMYGTLGGVCADASAAAAAHNAPARAIVKGRQKAATHCTHKLMRERASKKLGLARNQLKTQLADPKAIKLDHIKKHPMDAAARRIFQSLHLSLAVRKESGVFCDMVCASSDDESDN